MNFKVGDKVRLKKGLVIGRDYGGIYFMLPMKLFEGKILEIEFVDGKFYQLKEDKEKYSFSDEMLEPIKFTKSDLRYGDKLTLRNGVSGFYRNEETYIDGLDEDNINDDLTNNGVCGSRLDIVKVERPRKYKTVYEREEEEKVREMTVEEISKALGYEVKVVKSHE